MRVNYIHEREAGRGNPSLTTIQRICTSYKLTPNALFYGKDAEPLDFSQLESAKLYSLCELMLDFDLIYDQYKSFLSIPDPVFRKRIAICSAIIHDKTKSRLEKAALLLDLIKNKKV